MSTNDQIEKDIVEDSEGDGLMLFDYPVFPQNLSMRMMTFDGDIRDLV
jgi:hypothetical protein